MVSNYSSTFRFSIGFLSILFFLLFSPKTRAQTYVVWNSAGGANTLTGSFPGGTVTVTETGPGNLVSISSPSSFTANIVTTGSRTFSTFGPSTTPPSKSLTFTFSTPVIITRYNMGDIDLGGTWNDTFTFSGVTFTGATGSDCTATVGGAVATGNLGNNAEFASWTNSTTAITSFSINYANTGGKTHAFLAYSLEVMLAPTSATVTVNNTFLCPSQTATVTATPGSPGTYSYAWTVPAGVPNPGNVASFTTTIAGTYSVVITNLTTGSVSASSSGTVTAYTVETPVFNQINPICSGNTLTLPTTSTNGITGTWSPAVDNSQTTTYTFTPTSNPCATTASMTVVVTPRPTPLFTQIAPICEGNTLGALPTTSTNGFTGTWTPALNNTQTTTYTFTPISGECATTTTMTIVVDPRVTPQFTQVAEICSGDTLAALPTTSNNGITGSWLPALSNLQTTTYTFTPDASFCATSTQMTIIVNPILTPTFTPVNPSCFGSSVILPNLSNNGVSGTWSPNFNPIATTLYTFTPNPGQCAIPTTMQVVVLDDFDFEIIGECQNNNFILQVAPLGNSFDSDSAGYEWQNNAISVGNNSSSFNVTSYVNSTLITETLPLTFDVIVTDSNNCIKTKSISVENMYCDIQNGISPNNDNLNDFFDLRLLEVKHLNIFNRYGVKVYDKENYTDQWRGQTNSGESLPTGTYYYLIEFKNNKNIKTGWIYINREIK